MARFGASRLRSELIAIGQVQRAVIVVLEHRQHVDARCVRRRSCKHRGAVELDVCVLDVHAHEDEVASTIARQTCTANVHALLGSLLRD